MKTRIILIVCCALLVCNGCMNGGAGSLPYVTAGSSEAEDLLDSSVIFVPDWSGAEIAFSDLAQFIQESVRVHDGWNGVVVNIPPVASDRIVRGDSLQQNGKYGRMLLRDLLSCVAKETGTYASITEDCITFIKH